MAKEVSFKYHCYTVSPVLFRGLHFIVTFFQCIIDDSDEKTENLAPFLKKAYTDTLERYHGWMGTKLFGVTKNYNKLLQKLL